MKLHDDPMSGNGYKVRLLLAYLGRPYEYVRLDILRRETRTPGFLRLNPNGRIPLLELDDGRCLAESNAILYWLAQGTAFWPADPFEQARVLQWLFFEQYNHEPNVATSRFWLKTGVMDGNPLYPDLLAMKQAAGRQALAVMEGYLSAHEWFVGAGPTLADIALYAYTHVAGEGGFDLGGFPSVQAWLERMAARPHHVSIDDWPRRPVSARARPA